MNLLILVVDDVGVAFRQYFRRGFRVLWHRGAFVR